MSAKLPPLFYWLGRANSGITSADVDIPLFRKKVQEVNLSPVDLDWQGCQEQAGTKEELFLMWDNLSELKKYFRQTELIIDIHLN